MAENHIHDPARLLGTVVAQRYRVLRLIGQGSMGVVYEVEDGPRGGRAALKVLLPETAVRADAAARFEREGKAMSVLAHRNIVEILDCGRLPDATRFLVTELVRGVSLRELIDEGWVEQSRALSIVRQILEALAHAHALGVVHRDIKPENIMLADGGWAERGTDLVKILDFGVAKLLGDTLAALGEADLTRTGFNVLGPPLYMAPEPLLGHPVDARADLYSIGVILFELLAGRPPFVDANPIALAHLHAFAPVPTLRATDPDRAFTPQLEHVVAEALAKKPEQRFASAAEMLAAVDAARASLEPEREMITSAPVHGTIQSLLPPVPTQGLAAPPAPHEHLDDLPYEWPSLGRIRRAWQAVRAFIARQGRRRLILGGTVFAAFLLIVSVASVTARDPARRGPFADPPAGDRDTFTSAGHAAMARGQFLDAASAYDRALALAPSFAADPEVRANLIQILATRDTAAAMVALDLLAGRVRPAARDEIAVQASSSQSAPVRHRAFAIAERDGFAGRIDRVTSWSLDLLQATTCDDRRSAVAKLRATSDRRALAALRRARTQAACIKSDATEAIAYLEALP